MAKKSQKNSKHVADLINSATLPALSLLAQVDKFAFLGVLDATKPEHQARSELLECIPSVKREDITIADQEAVRLLQLVRFRTEEMLEHAYRHSLIEIRDWLHELVETLADPMATVHRRGLPTSGYVELPLTLELTAAPELAGLSRWAERQSGYSGFSSSTSLNRKSGLGFWGTVGAVVLGWGIGEALFGDDDCGTGGT